MASIEAIAEKFANSSIAAVTGGEIPQLSPAAIQRAERKAENADLQAQVSELMSAGRKKRSYDDFSGCRSGSFSGCRSDACFSAGKALSDFDEDDDFDIGTLKDF
jgi:hypothetical protein